MKTIIAALITFLCIGYLFGRTVGHVDCQNQMEIEGVK